MQSLILTLHIVVCVLLVILVLLQSGKEGMGVIFGGGNASVFGNTGAGGILVKLTTLMALIFVVTSLSYTYVTSAHDKQESTILDVKIEDPVMPATTTPPAAPKPEEAGGAAAGAPAKTDDASKDAGNGAVQNGAKDGTPQEAAPAKTPDRKGAAADSKEGLKDAATDAQKGAGAAKKDGAPSKDASGDKTSR